MDITLKTCYNFNAESKLYRDKGGINMTTILQSAISQEKFRKVIKYAVENPRTFGKFLLDKMKAIEYGDRRFLKNLLDVLVNSEYTEIGYETLKKQSKMRTESNKPLIYIKINEFLEEYSLEDVAKANPDLEKLARFVLLYDVTVVDDPQKYIARRIMEEKEVRIDFIKQQREKGVHENFIKIFEFTFAEVAAFQQFLN